MKLKMLWTLTATVSLTACGSYGGLKQGDKLQLRSNLHPDFARNTIYTTNYQLPDVIPVCTEVTVVDSKEKVLTFNWNGRDMEFAWDKHTRRAGVQLDTLLADFFGTHCDQAAMDTLSAIDKEGIETGKPRVGMSKQGILFAMGRPPYHANPSLDSNRWTYWRNRFARMIITFDDNGIVTKIR